MYAEPDGFSLAQAAERYGYVAPEFAETLGLAIELVTPWSSARWRRS